MEGVYIFLSDYAVDDADIHRNVIAGNEIGLAIEVPPFIDADVLGVRLSYHDFGDNAQPLSASALEFGPPPDYELRVIPLVKTTTLADNWWGGDTRGFPANPEVAEHGRSLARRLADREGVAEGPRGQGQALPAVRTRRSRQA